MHLRTRALLVVSFVGLLPALATAGPPLLCFPMSIGTAPSLPWGSGGDWHNPAATYDRTRLVGDTLALLTPTTPVLVRMETLRRATIYAAPDARAAAALIDALRSRAPNPDAAGADALALFDLGYAIEAARQTPERRGAAAATSGDGYALVRKALARRASDPAMQYAAALVALDHATSGLSSRHLQAALAGVHADTDLARTIDAHRMLWGTQVKTPATAARR